MLDIKTVKLRSEEEIIASWIEKEKIVVSVVCATYNHELYIEDAITGFLMQETDFAFEVIIHDDASTDKTASIIKRYQEQYSHIIKPIFQTENQYSKGKFKPSVYASNFAKGEYVALCEGDDYWCKKSKLQKQYEALSNNKKIKLCVHASLIFSSDNKFKDSSLRENDGEIISTAKFIIGGGGYVATSSLFIKVCVLKNMPYWFFEKAPVGDFYIQILSSYPHGAIYLNPIMSVYRKGAINNFSSKMENSYGKQALLRKKILEANLLCEKELNDVTLNYAFRKDNFWNYTFYLKNKIKIDSKIDCIEGGVSLFQWRFIYFTPQILMKLCVYIIRYIRHKILSF